MVNFNNDNRLNKLSILLLAARNCIDDAKIIFMKSFTKPVITRGFGFLIYQ